MAEPYVPSRPVYRRNEHRYVLPLVCFVFAALFVIPAIYTRPVVAVGAIPFLVLAYRIYRVGIFPSAGGVVVRNVLRTRRLAWGDIERFDWGTWGSFPIGGVYLRDGRFVRAYALNPPFEMKPGDTKAVPRELAGLNDELERARAAGLAAPATAQGRPARGAASRA